MRLCYHCMHQIEDEKVHTCPACGKPLKVRQENASEMLPPGDCIKGQIPDWLFDWFWWFWNHLHGGSGIAAQSSD